jgi:deoxycytidylate deaminase
VLREDNEYTVAYMHMKTLDNYAKQNTTDPKIYVGASVGKFINGEYNTAGVGCNKNDCYNEKEAGQTYREFLFGSRDKKYRPWDKIIHAEENAIVDAIKAGAEGKYDTAVVTRYPCEKCAQLMVYKGVKTVYYGRRFKISEEAEEIFKNAGVEVIHVKEYIGDENDDNT